MSLLLVRSVICPSRSPSSCSRTTYAPRLRARPWSDAWNSNVEAVDRRREGAMVALDPVADVAIARELVPHPVAGAVGRDVGLVGLRHLRSTPAVELSPSPRVSRPVGPGTYHPSRVSAATRPQPSESREMVTEPPARGSTARQSGASRPGPRGTSVGHVHPPPRQHLPGRHVQGLPVDGYGVPCAGRRRDRRLLGAHVTQGQPGAPIPDRHQGDVDRAAARSGRFAMSG